MDPAEYPYDKQYENKLNKVQTRSLLPTVTVDINTCFLCKKKKTFKKDRKLHKMESRDRVKKIPKCAEESNEFKHNFVYSYKIENKMDDKQSSHR
jgi:hypothetical protein